MCTIFLSYLNLFNPKAPTSLNSQSNLKLYAIYYLKLKLYANIICNQGSPRFIKDLFNVDRVSFIFIFINRFLFLLLLQSIGDERAFPKELYYQARGTVSSHGF